MAEKSFQFRPEDYLNWFSDGYAEKNKVVLPKRMTGGRGIILESESENLPSQTPLYKRYDLGTDYSKEHVSNHIQAHQETQATGQSKIHEKEPKRYDLNSISTVTRIEEHQENERSIDVYSRYDFNNYNKESLKLPVIEHKEEVLSKLENYSVVVIQGETGSGKSTQVPQFILDDGYRNRTPVNIVVTQPRRIAAISLANRVSEERQWELGTVVGFQVGLNRKVHPDTRISYVTTEVLVQKLVRNKNLDMYTHIILDEVHERDQHTDFALLLVKKLLNTVSPEVKVILMSATIDCEKFANYYSTPVMGILIPAPVLCVSQRKHFPVETFYLDSLKTIPTQGEKFPQYTEDQPGITEDMYKFAVRVLKCFDQIERAEENKSSLELPSDRGAVLVFLPGIFEIESLVELLRKDQNLLRWEFYPLHSTLTLDEQKAVFKRAKPGFRKIIVSTNIAESSITVPDIKYVIDFCLTKNLACDSVTNYTYLKLDWASKASCDQRAGRAGRVSKGTVCRLVHEDFYSTLPFSIVPEMLRTPLTNIVLKVKLLDMGQPQALLGLALDPPNVADIHRTILVLKQIGHMCIKKEGIVSSTDGDLSFMGEISAHLPVDPHLSKLIVMGYLFGCLKETIIIAAGLSLKNFHSRPFQDELNAYLSKISWAFGSYSDCIAIYHTYSMWEHARATGQFEPESSSKERQWAKKSYVQLNLLKDVHKLVTELTDRLKSINIEQRGHTTLDVDKKTLLLKMCMAAAFYPNYFKRIVPLDYERDVVRELNGNNHLNTLILANLPPDSRHLYHSQLKQIFKNCYQDPDIMYDGKKAYFQFTKKKINMTDKNFKDIPTDFSTSMHLALKMRQIQRLQKLLRLNLYSQEEARTRLNEIARRNSSVQSDSSSGTASASCKGLKLPALPHPTAHSIKIQVIHIENAGHFWAMCADSSSTEAYSYIQKTIDLATQQELRVLSKNEISPGMYCLAPYGDGEEKDYYRARIEDVQSLKEVLVFFVDYGNTLQLESNKLLTMPESLYSVRMSAFECELSEVKPASKHSNSGWNEEANYFVTQAIMNKEFDAEIYSVVHNVVRVKLHLHCYPPVTLNEQLINLGYATFAEEILLSKRNHNLRAIYTADMQSESNPRENQSDSQMSSLSLYGNSDEKEKKFSYLRGPYSPAEMKFTAINNNSGGRSVRIDSSSVNSTILDKEPQEPYDRMMVSSFVSLSPNGSTVTLRDTTMMPYIPGILSLSLLLFSPIVELRVNDECTKYTGAIVGLGRDPNTGSPVYEEDDIEIEFDILFTHKDLDKVNAIRYLMSSVLERGRNLSDIFLFQVQKKLCSNILELLDENRSYVEPETFYDCFKWNRIPLERLLEPKLAATEGPDTTVSAFPLINPIDLEKGEGSVLVSLLSKFNRYERQLNKEKQPEAIVGVICPVCDVYLRTVGDLSEHTSNDEHKIHSTHFGL